MLNLDNEDFQGSMDLFKKAGGVSGLLGQASVHTQQGDTENAMARLQEALEKDPDRPGAKIALAMLLVQGAEERGQATKEDRQCNEADWSRASNLCRDTMGRGAESDAAALACRAQLALDRGHSRAAESLFQEARECNPYGSHTAALANVLIGMHRKDDAVKMLNERLSKNGSGSSAYFQLYSALLARGDSKAALSALRAALALATAPTSDTP
jgi:tetratricopeptide (TPR) repeat protein